MTSRGNSKISFLETLRDKERLSIPDAELAAEQLVATWLGVDQLELSLGVSGPPSPHERDAAGMKG